MASVGLLRLTGKKAPQEQRLWPLAQKPAADEMAETEKDTENAEDAAPEQAAPKTPAAGKKRLSVPNLIVLAVSAVLVVLGLGDLMEFAENMSPLGNASAEDCADYVLTLFSDLTRKVTMQNLYHDGGFSSMGMSRRAMKTYEKGMRFEDVHENQYPFGK